MLPRTIPILLITLLMLANSFPAKANEVDARRLINALGCKACHKLQGDGGSLAPDLDEVGSRMTRSQIKKFLQNHGTSNRESFVPKYNTTPQAELTIISDFLYQLQ